MAPSRDQVDAQDSHAAGMQQPPRVYWSHARGAFVGKRPGDRSPKAVPRSVARSESDRPAAEAWFASWCEQEAPAAEAKASLPSKRTIRTLGERWVEHLRTLPDADPRLHKDGSRVLRKWLLPHRIADVELSELKASHAAEWIAWMRTRERRPGVRLAPLTVRNVVAMARRLLDDAIAPLGWLDGSNPFRERAASRALGKPERRCGDDVVVVLEEDELRRLLASPPLSEERGALDALAALSGLRAGEIAALRWRDVCLEAGVIEVERQLTTDGRIKLPKRRSVRQVPIHSRLAPILSRWKSSGWPAFVGREPRDDDPAFPRSDGSFARHPHQALRFREDLAHAGVSSQDRDGNRRTFHSLRRTFMTLLSVAGVPLERIAALAGHGQKTVTSRSYVARNVESFRADVERILKVRPISAARSRRRTKAA